MVAVSQWTVLVNSSSAALSKVLNVAVLLWMHQHLLKRIAPEEYSLYPAILGLTVFLPLLATLLTSGLGNFVMQAYATADHDRIGQIVSTMFPLLAGAGLIVLGLGLLAAWHADVLLNVDLQRLSDARRMLVLMVLPVALSFVTAPFSCGLWVRQKFVSINAVELGSEILRAALLLVLLLGVSTRVLWLAVASSAALTCKLLALQLLSRRALPSLRLGRSTFHAPTAGALCLFGAWSLLGQLADKLRAGMHPLILKTFATAADVATFNIGWIFYNQIYLAEYLVTRPLQPPLTALHAQGDRRRLASAYLRGGRYGLWATLLVVAPLWLYRQEFVLLYAGPAYAAAASVLGLLLLAFPLEYGNNMMVRLAYASGVLRPWAWRILVIQLLVLLTTLFVVARLRAGAVGAAATTIGVTALAQPLVMWPLGWRLAGVSAAAWLRQTLLPGLLPALAGGLAWLAAREVLPITTWPRLLADGALGAIVYVCAVAAVGLGTSETHRLLDLLGHGWARLRPRPAVPVEVEP